MGKSRSCSTKDGRVGRKAGNLVEVGVQFARVIYSGGWEGDWGGDLYFLTIIYLKKEGGSDRPFL